jgi:hypothetical protein
MELYSTKGYEAPVASNAGWDDVLSVTRGHR